MGHGCTLDRCLWECPPVRISLSSVFRILTLSSHVVPRGIWLPFELVCHIHRDELVIIASRLNFLGKKACPSDTLPVLWRGQRRDGFAGLISRLCFWCLRERRWQGLKQGFHLMNVSPQPDPSALVWGPFLLACEIRINVWLLIKYLWNHAEMCGDLVKVFTDLSQLLHWWPSPTHSIVNVSILPGDRHNGGELTWPDSDVSACPCLCPDHSVRGLMPGKPMGGMLPRSEEGDVKHIEEKETSCWALWLKHVTVAFILRNKRPYML